MPTAAPSFKPLGYRARAQRKREADREREGDRIRGRRRIERNRLVLCMNPLCVVCEAAGKTVMATEVDHIVPLFMGGTEDGENLQGLCHTHHVEKTTKERRGRGLSLQP